MKKLTISQLAKKTQVSIDTLRYYEKEGIISPPERTDSGYRQYSDEYIDRIIFIKKAQELGFSLAEITELLQLNNSSDPQLCDDVRTKAMKKLENIQEKIDLLNQMKRVLQGMISSCENRSPSDDCPILEVLFHQRNEKE